MAIPKNKRKVITVNETEYYWRVDGNICLYIETGKNPNFIIKAFFGGGKYFAVPKVVRTVIDYVIANKLDNKRLTIIENGEELFKEELARQYQKRKEEYEESVRKWNEKNL